MAMSPIDRDASFERESESVLLEVDGDTDEYPLSATFWSTCPELRGRGIQRGFGGRPWLHGRAAEGRSWASNRSAVESSA